MTITAEVGKGFVPYLRRHLRKARRELARGPGELSVGIVGDAKMGALHEQFMGIAGPTDVLTFELEHDAGGRVTAGEVVVCLGAARRQARERKTSVGRELLLYALHGLLHLSGFDDRTAADYRKMHRTEDDILGAIGVGAVFAPAEKRAQQKGRGPRDEQARVASTGLPLTLALSRPSASLRTGKGRGDKTSRGRGRCAGGR